MDNVLSVSDVNKYIKLIFQNDFILSNLSVQGEISNFKVHSSGHMYFTIKDSISVLKCIMFKNSGRPINFNPDNGMKVTVKGYISVYERDGSYQFYVQSMQKDGIGNLYFEFEKLKQKLKDEGLFNEVYKKPLPFLPQSIGVLTSPTGSVIKDIINVLNRRAQHFQLKIFPIPVQGSDAALKISDGIKVLNKLDNVDVIIIARGGGSLEELWPFNEEILARAIFESQIPIISAVGHETDFTISDFVADLRAPTPSAAAEMVMPEKIAIERKIYSLRQNLISSIYGTINLRKIILERFTNSSIFRQPYDKVYQERLRLNMLNSSLKKDFKSYKNNIDMKFKLLIEKLDALSPLKIIDRGYSIVKKDEQFIKKVNDVKIGDNVRIYMRDGNFSCTINKTERGNIYG